MKDKEKNLNQDSSLCALLDDYLDDRTDPAECSAFEQHLSSCANCRNQVESSRILGNAFEPLSRLTMPDDSDLRIRIALWESQRQSRSGTDVMDIDEAAAFLGISVSELVNRLEELPAFEIAGRIRFNRERLIRWMERKERDLAWETSLEKTSSKSNILTFPGGFYNDQFNRKANGSTA